MSNGLGAALAAFQEAALGPLRVVDVAVGEIEGQVVVVGRVLTERQMLELKVIAREHGAQVRVDLVADPDSGLELGWAEPTVELLEVWRAPEMMGHDSRRQTEYLASDGPVRKLGALGDAVLVQGSDLTIGWTPAAALREISGDVARARWESLRRAAPGRAIAAEHGVTGAAVAQAARAQLGVPYRWGGTTERGFDCSGLVQRVTAGVTGVLLPKHSSDQRRVGLRVTTAERRAGDLVFASMRARNVGHVMLLTGSDTVLHACQAERSVIEEPLATAEERYQLRGYRRPVILEN